MDESDKDNFCWMVKLQAWMEWLRESGEQLVTPSIDSPFRVFEVKEGVKWEKLLEGKVESKESFI